jgi:hypothetical protein
MSITLSVSLRNHSQVKTKTDKHAILESGSDVMASQSSWSQWRGEQKHYEEKN